MSLTVSRISHQRQGAKMVAIPVTTGRKLNKRQKKQVKRLIGNRIETDYYDNGLLGTSMTSTGTIQAGFSTPPQGVSDGQRVGDKIRLSAFRFSYDIIGGDATNVCRVIIFRWYQDSNAAIPTVANVIQSVALGGVNSAINHDNIKKGLLHIMYDKVHTTTVNGNNAVHRVSKTVGRRLGKKGIEFNNAAVTGVNFIYALFISDSVAASHPTINWYSRMEYSDA